MTDLMLLYRRQRQVGRGHHRALNELADALGVDKATMARTLRRAEQELGPAFDEAERRRVA
jgi:DNA-binding MarR family transcriptional regulator